jgi:hypothetical protein
VGVRLPEGTSWTPDGDRRSATGARIRRWRFRPVTTSPACVVTVGEQPDYHGSFPAAALTAFAATRESGADVVRNESIAPPPAGTIAAIRQEQTFVSVVPGQGTTRSHLYVREALTSRRTLVAVYAASSDDVAAACRPDQVTESLTIRPGPTGPSSTTAPFSTTTAVPQSSTGGAP